MAVSVYEFRGANTCSNTYNEFNPSMYVVPYEEYSGSVENIAVPILFSDRRYDDSGISRYGSFPTAFNNTYRGWYDCVRPIIVGKSDILYVGKASAFTEDKKPLYLKVYRERSPYVILSSDFVFSDNVWCNNMRLKIFRAMRDEVIINDELLNNMILKPKLAAGHLDISKDVNDFLKSDYGKRIIAERITRRYPF